MVLEVHVLRTLRKVYKSKVYILKMYFSCVRVLMYGVYGYVWVSVRIYGCVSVCVSVCLGLSRLVLVGVVMCVWEFVGECEYV